MGDMAEVWRDYKAYHGIHREMAHDAGARARAAIARAEGRV